MHVYRKTEPHNPDKKYFFAKKILQCRIFHAAERIRTPDTLVRSQVLYPAELLPHINNKQL